MMSLKPVRRMACVAAAVAAAAVCWRPSMGVWLYILAGVALLAVLAGLYCYTLARITGVQRITLIRRVLNSLIPRVSSGDPQVAAKVDQLRQRFEKGVEMFRRAGRDLYSVPWYLFLGESGAGKTEASAAEYPWSGS